MSLDHTLADHARTAGAKLQERTTVTGPERDERSGRVVGVRAKVDGETVTYRAPVVIAADGVSARLATGMGLEKRMDRPMGVAVRTYFQTPRHDDPWMESHLELRDDDGNLMPGYGWIFSLGDGTANVGLGSVASTAAPTKVDYKKLFATWMRHVPAEWEFTPDNQVGPVKGAALPDGVQPRAALRQRADARGRLRRDDQPVQRRGHRVRPAGGRVAADAISQGLARGTAAGRERAFATYQRRMKDDLGGYYTLGRVFVRLIEHPEVMRVCTRYGLPRPLDHEVRAQAPVRLLRAEGR